MIQEPIILGQNTRYPLKGLLTLPAGNGPFPALVLVHGSGSSNMDEKTGKLTPFKDIAQGLAARGIACIRYDKRSCAHGLKMVLDKKHPITVREEVIDDALLAARLLRGHSRIDPDRVFLLGHSMGGMLAPPDRGRGRRFRGPHPAGRLPPAAGGDSAGPDRRNGGIHVRPEPLFRPRALSLHTQWYAQIQSDGSQIWARVWNGSIFNGGINEVPREWNPVTGLNNNPFG